MVSPAKGAELATSVYGKHKRLPEKLLTKVELGERRILDFNTAGGQEHNSRRLPMLFFACRMFKLDALEKTFVCGFIFGDLFISLERKKKCVDSAPFFFFYKCNTNKGRWIL